LALFHWHVSVIFFDTVIVDCHHIFFRENRVAVFCLGLVFNKIWNFLINNIFIIIHF
jgi:hypothetical protein